MMTPPSSLPPSSTRLLHPLSPILLLLPPSSSFLPPSSLLDHQPYFTLLPPSAIQLPLPSSLHPPPHSFLRPPASSYRPSAHADTTSSTYCISTESRVPHRYLQQLTVVDPPPLTYSSHQFGPPPRAAPLHASDWLVVGGAWVGGGWNLAPTGSAGLFIH